MSDPLAHIDEAVKRHPYPGTDSDRRKTEPDGYIARPKRIDRPIQSHVEGHVRVTVGGRPVLAEDVSPYVTVDEFGARGIRVGEPN